MKKANKQEMELRAGFAAAISKKDAYAWSIPLGDFLGMGIANTNC